MITIGIEGQRQKREMVSDMGVLSNDPMMGIADSVAYCFSERGYAFIEDDKSEALADTLRLFLTAAGIPTNNAVDGNEPQTAPQLPAP